MKSTQKLLFMSFFAVFLLFSSYGCQTTDSTVSSEQSVSELTSGNTGSDAGSVERFESQASTVEKETSATSVTVTDETVKTARNEKEVMEKFGNNFLGILKGHGGTTPSDESGKKEAVNRDKPGAGSAAKSTNLEERPYREMEKQLYGKWINKLETESYDFHDNGTVTIVISGPRGKIMKLNGNFKIVEANRIKIDFRNDTMASQKPPSYFKISISENEFSLTDEPTKKGGPDGPTTIYNRVK